ncbi:Secreted effector kinase SteC [Salmonella enterica]|nr:Secreted effector kinase SteC [Salmonella enterica]EDZ3859621.1 Secreted effector kinase SteC [Salmonella enterica]EEA2458470.1 Secreted effector kinase SteC [Salmonella enterica]EEA5032332.1 Secreted effector kinase SteC [Salmonella enterica]EEA7138297.1 Secreted effector kinase SteC [Salmonella enterica]
MPFTFHIGDHNCRISESYLRDIIEYKREHIFSTYEKFMDFFRIIFTRRSLISDYKEIYDLLCQKKERPEIKGPFPLKQNENCTRWRPILGCVKLIDVSRPEVMDKYTVEVLAYQEDMSLLKMYYDGVLLAEAECSKRCLEFLKETMFNYNTGEITLASLENENFPLDEANGNGRYAAFEQRLIEYLSPPPGPAGDNGATAQAASLQAAETDVFDSGAIDQTDSQQVPEPEIDRFINSEHFKKNFCMADIEKNKIGSGSYGTVYLLNGEFVVKVPINGQGMKVDFTSPEHGNCHPERVSKYLNQANDDRNFSRSAIMSINGSDVTVLVSKYIQGQELDIEDEDNYNMAEELLEERGVYMHDMNVFGNILVKEGKLYFVDGDQIVQSKQSRHQRAASLATKKLEEQIMTHHKIKLKQAETEGNEEDIEYYKALIMDLDELIGVEPPAPEPARQSEPARQPEPARHFKIAPPEEGTLVAKVLKDKFKK